MTRPFLTALFMTACLLLLAPDIARPEAGRDDVPDPVAIPMAEVRQGLPWDILYPEPRSAQPQGRRLLFPNPGDTLRWDDGTAWTWIYYFVGGNGWGAEFEPYYYPCRVSSLIQYFPAGWPDPGGDDLILWVMDDDGVDGSPGTILFADTLYDAVTLGSWNEFTLGDTGVVVQDGYFYGVYIQMEDGPNCPAVTFDNGYDIQHSWNYYNGSWEPSTTYGDLMLRAYTERAGGDAHDVGVKEIVSPGGEYDPSAPMDPEATVKNWGTFTESFYVACEIENEGVVYEDSVSVSTLGPDESRQVSFSSFQAQAGNVYDVTVATHLAGDVTPMNDFRSVTTHNYTVARDQVLVEDATGTWCYWCQFAADGLDTLRMFVGDSVAVVSYHNDDDFSNESSEARIVYYNVSAYPTVIFNGTERVVGGAPGMYNGYRTMFNSEFQENVPVDILLQGSYNDQTRMAFVQVDMNAVDGIAATDLRLYIALTESHIAYNWFDKDSLQFVLREMLPDEEGLPIVLNKGDSHREQLNFPVDTAYVDGNCDVVVFLQDHPTGEVLGSASSPLNMLTVSIGEGDGGPVLPVSFALFQNYPNPFNPRTTIDYRIPEGDARDVQLAIYDLRGRVVKVLDSGLRSPGSYSVVWDGRDGHGNSVGSGIYLYRLKVEGWNRTSKMVLLK